MRWTVGSYSVRVVPVGNILKPSILSCDTLGRDVSWVSWWYQLGFYQTVHSDHGTLRLPELYLYSYIYIVQ